MGTEKDKKTVSVVMIVKNEEALLSRCLESVRDADEIIVCDTGSTDGTLEVARKYTNKIFTDFTWNDSFCDARNHAKSKATGDWILSIDADEYCHNFLEIKKAIELAKDNISVYMHSHGSLTNFFKVPRLFRNDPDIIWCGAVHNHLGVTPEGEKRGMNMSGEGEIVGDVHITYDYSQTHEKDPDRSLRILLKEVEDPTKVREMYYLGREYLSKGKYELAIMWFGKHVVSTNFTAEKADSFLSMARCYSTLGMDDDARDACLQAIKLNPYFKEAVLFMAAIVQDNHAAPWRHMAEVADSRDVLFKRI
ncbi:MAG: glycosyltransferase [Patescibacteria group bacterium]